MLLAETEDELDEFLEGAGMNVEELRDLGMTDEDI
jgi:hypothetical protein